MFIVSFCIFTLKRKYISFSKEVSEANAMKILAFKKVSIPLVGEMQVFNSVLNDGFSRGQIDLGKEESESIPGKTWDGLPKAFTLNGKNLSDDETIAFLESQGWKLDK